MGKDADVIFLAFSFFFMQNNLTFHENITLQKKKGDFLVSSVLCMMENNDENRLRQWLSEIVNGDDDGMFFSSFFFL